MADAPHLTTDQANFCRAVEAMKLDLLRSGKEARWLVAHPGLLAHVWGPAEGARLAGASVCGLQVLELPGCPADAFSVTHRRPDSA